MGRSRKADRSSNLTRKFHLQQRKNSIILKYDHGQTLSESTVGRILKFLFLKGLITKSPSALRTKRRRAFKKHAIPWTFKGYKTITLGKRLQIDHMTVTKNAIIIKHFQAWDRRSKYMDAGVYSTATVKSAKKFLLHFIAKAPFPILSIQVDGGFQSSGLSLKKMASN